MHRSRITLVSIAALLAGGQAVGALKLIGSAADADFNVPTTSGASRSAAFTGIGEPCIGIGITARYTTVSGDFENGLGPWSLDVTMAATSPGAVGSGVFNPISGDVTIADYPLQDGSTVYGAGVAGDGTWMFNFGSTTPQGGWTYGLRDVTYHLLASAPDVMTAYDATPVSGQEWNRPYYIGGVSGQGPVAYEAYAFTVEVSGVYGFTSVLASGANHFTFLYQDGFNPAAPLSNLLDYGLGNGSSFNGDPSGTSSFDALLIAGRTYTWVTSQWAFFSAIETAGNTIVGPGAIVALAACRADINGDGVVDTADLGLLIGQFGTAGPEADLNMDGVVDTADLGILIGEFGSMCL